MDIRFEVEYVDPADGCGGSFWLPEHDDPLSWHLRLMRQGTEWEDSPVDEGLWTTIKPRLEARVRDADGGYAVAEGDRFTLTV